MRKAATTRRQVALVLGASWALVGAAVTGCDAADPDGAPPTAQDPSPSSAGDDDGSEILLKSERMFVPPAVQENVRRIDAQEDGWRSEVLHDLAKPVFHEFLHRLLMSSGDDVGWEDVLSDGFSTTRLRPSELASVFDDGSLRVARAAGDEEASFSAADIATLRDELLSPYAKKDELHERLKVIGIEVPEDPAARRFELTASVQIYGRSRTEAIQQNMHWTSRWSVVGDDEEVRLESVRVDDYEEVHAPAPLFGELTKDVFEGFEAFDDEYLIGAGQYQDRVDLLLGNAFWGFQGLAVGDVDDDGREDLYVPHQAGLPNRMFLRGEDGRMVDHTRASRTGYLENTASALILDMDNDGLQDLVLGLGQLVAIAHNEGATAFGPPKALRGTSPAPVYSLSAADPDRDGDLDVYACRHSKRGLLYEIPTPYFDANNGSANSYFANDGARGYHDATAEVGLDGNNTKFSYASTWEDLDDDGDPDLYVANDYGRNNLYRNESGRQEDGALRFVDVAFETGAEDVSAGMGASCADFDLDGDMDIYVSNMFSSAGRRITEQGSFQHADNPEVHGYFKRHARGNTLLANAGDGTFQDVTEAAGVAPGGWAWGARFVDLNNDGLADIHSPCGFVTGADPDDL